MRKTRALFVVLLVCMLAGCQSQHMGHEHQYFYQNTAVISLLNGVYDGQMSVAEIRRHGTQGVGTWDKLDGEGIILDGVFYQVLSDGSVRTPPDSAIMPFAQVTHFQAEGEMPLPRGLSYAELADFLDPLLATVNTYYALRLQGTFKKVQTRSLPEQHKPYPPFWKVQLTEPKFNFQTVHGTMVGFRSPPYATNFDPTDYHLHFLTKDRDAGGHVLSFVTEDVVLYLDRINRFEIELPTNKEFEQADLSQIDQPPTTNH